MARKQHTKRSLSLALSKRIGDFLKTTKTVPADVRTFLLEMQNDLLTEVVGVSDGLEAEDLPEAPEPTPPRLVDDGPPEQPLSHEVPPPRPAPKSPNLPRHHLSHPAGPSDRELGNRAF